jgi:hypothetical protein
VDVADPAAAPDGRVVIVIEDSAGSTAAATLGAIALWPEVLNTSLVYEYSGPDSPPPDDVEGLPRLAPRYLTARARHAESPPDPTIAKQP